MTDAELAKHVDAHPDKSMDAVASRIGLTRAALYNRATAGSLLAAAIKRRQVNRKKKPTMTQVSVSLTEQQIERLSRRGELSAEIRRCVEESLDALG